MNGGDFFRPFWRRLIIIIVAAAWAAFEWWMNEPLWAMMATGVTAWGIWSFLLNYEETKKSDASGKDSGSQ